MGSASARVVHEPRSHPFAYPRVELRHGIAEPGHIAFADQVGVAIRKRVPLAARVIEFVDPSPNLLRHEVANHAQRLTVMTDFPHAQLAADQ